MKKLYILHENKDWIAPIIKVMKDKNIELEELYIADSGLIDLTKAPPQGIFFNRISPSSHSRGHKYSVFYCYAILNWLERHGRRVINGLKVLDLEISKIAQYNALSKAGIKAPVTIAAFSKEDVRLGAAKISFPLMLKHNWGGKGLGVRLFRNNQVLEQYLNSNEFEESLDGITLIQQYIESTQPRIIRAEFIGHEFIYAVSINNEQGFNLCPADSCSIEDNFCPTSATENKFNIISDFEHPILIQYKKFLMKHNIEVAGIEFIIDKAGDIYTYDVNANTNYSKAAEQKSGLSATDELAKFINGLCHIC